MNFPSSQYPYAIESFGNNGSTSRSGAATSSNNHALDDLANTTPNAATVYADLQLTGMGSTSTGSDHYPVVGDYLVVPAPVILTAVSPGTNSSFQLRLTSTPNTYFEIQVSDDLSSWNNLIAASTDANGILTYQETNARIRRFYRAIWPVP